MHKFANGGLSLVGASRLIRPKHIPNLEFGDQEFVVGWHIVAAVVTDGPHGVVVQQIIDPKTGHGPLVGGFQSPARLAKGVYHPRAQLSVRITHRNVIEIAANNLGKIARNHALLHNRHLLCPAFVAQPQPTDDPLAPLNVQRLLPRLLLHDGVVFFGESERLQMQIVHPDPRFLSNPPLRPMLRYFHIHPHRHVSGIFSQQ